MGFRVSNVDAVHGRLDHVDGSHDGQDSVGAAHIDHGIITWPFRIQVPVTIINTIGGVKAAKS